LIAIRGFSFSALLALVACIREAVPPHSSPPPDTMSVSAPPFDTLGNLPGLSSKDSLCGHLVENGLAIPNSRRTAVTSQFGRPDSTQSEPTPNKHNPAQTDSTVTVFYPGLRLHYIVLGAKEGGTDVLYRADVSSNRYLKYPSLGIGASREAIVNAVGEPEERTADRARYSCVLHIMAGVTLDFHFEGHRVKFVEYWFDFD
jgi:hypothetical protein